MNVFWTGDKHHQHINILKYDNRPFKNIEEHDQKLIFNHNQIVNQDDICYDLGDFYFKGGWQAGKKAYKYFLNQYNGRYVIIRGNHEKSNKIVDRIQSASMYIGGLKIFMVHDPINSKIDYDINLVAHVHNAWKFTILKKKEQESLLINVGVTQWKYRPVSWDEIYAIYCRWKKGIIKPELFDKEKLKRIRTERRKNK
ncbi:MAG: hypothetical protein ACTSXT_08140 [Candidatus Helarchaeota archaeon]